MAVDDAEEAHDTSSCGDFISASQLTSPAHSHAHRLSAVNLTRPRSCAGGCHSAALSHGNVTGVVGLGAANAGASGPPRLR